MDIRATIGHGLSYHTRQDNRPWTISLPDNRNNDTINFVRKLLKLTGVNGWLGILALKVTVQSEGRFQG